ncbi:MAG: argininosuccinate lyase [Phototrophicaceae bacterium]|jgi:argininosuccinate lyase
MTLWGGRFSEPTDADLRRLNDSLPFDKRFADQDIRGSVAYTRAIQLAGIITPLEAEKIVDGLYRVQSEIASGNFEFQPSDEDIHTAVERRLIEIIGELGGKLHTGRSRNDQVATDFRLWAMEAVDEIITLIYGLQTALVNQADEHAATLMTGFTHLQPAQPITAGHWLMSYFWMIGRDVERLVDAKRRASVLPLGAGALSGNPFAIDRHDLAQQLGFDAISLNSLDAVSDRDFVAEILFALALLGVHLSRFAEDVIIYSNPSFGYIRLNDRYSTGSSLMPQKRNADPMELARGKAGRMIGNLTGLMATLKGLPSSYNKDMQEDKEALFDSVDTLKVLLPVVAAVAGTLHFNVEKMRESLDEMMLATDLADYLVKRGMPFRQAHHIAGEAVSLAEQRGVTLSQLSYEDYKGLHPLFESDIHTVFDFDQAVARRKGEGGTAPESVKKQVQRARLMLDRAQK